MAIMRLAAAVALTMTAAVPGAAATAGKRAEDPDRQICKSRSVVGSRLKRIRECATAQQWQEFELQEKVGLLRKQVNGDPGCSGGGGGGGQSCNPVATGGKDTPW